MKTMRSRSAVVGTGTLDLIFQTGGPHLLFHPVLFAMFQRDFIIKARYCKYRTYPAIKCLHVDLKSRFL